MLLKLFSENEVNSERQPELDFAKTFAALLMIICHTGIMFVPENRYLSFAFDFIGGEGSAPVFMFCMGIAFCYSGNQSAEYLIRRGIKTVLTGYCLNFLRLVLPYIVFSSINSSAIDFNLIIQYLLLVDILQFAGLSMILIAVFRKFNVSPIGLLGVSILLEALSEQIVYKPTGSIVLNQIIGLFVQTTGFTCFSLFSWLIFPASGFIFGTLLKHCNDKQRLYKLLFPFSGIVSVYVFCVSLLSYFTDITYYSADNYYAMGVKSSLLAVFVVITIICIGDYLQTHLNSSVKTVFLMFQEI